MKSIGDIFFSVNNYKHFVIFSRNYCQLHRSHKHQYVQDHDHEHEHGEGSLRKITEVENRMLQFL